MRELTTRSRTGKWRCPILPVSVPTSTFGVRKLNFCVRYGNRWNLSAIITTMVIYQTITVKHIRIMFLNTMHPFSEVILSLTPCLIFSAFPPFKNFSFQSPFPKIDNYIANNFSYKRKIFLFSFYKLVKIIEISVKRFVRSCHSKEIEIKPSTY